VKSTTPRRQGREEKGPEDGEGREGRERWMKEGTGRKEGKLISDGWQTEEALVVLSCSIAARSTF